jgi:hypothetical protein
MNSEINRATLVSLIAHSLNMLYAILRPNSTVSENATKLLMSNAIMYFVDILFVKHFDNKSMKHKFTWLKDSFKSYMFVKYFMFMFITIIMNELLLNHINEVLKSRNIAFKYQNTIITILLNSVSFALYAYYLKFKWVYSETNDHMMNITIISWFSISLMIYTLSNKITTCLSQSTQK